MSITIVLLALLALSGAVLAYPGNVANNYAANPPNYNSRHNCHDSYAINSGSGLLEINGLPANGYTSGQHCTQKLLLLK